MISQNELKDLIQKVMQEVQNEGLGQVETRPNEATNSESIGQGQDLVEDKDLRDITVNRMQDTLYVPDPENRDQYMKLKSKTPARLGIWRAGNRFNTESLLRFRADHAVAQDAVFSYVSEDFIKELGLKTYQTMCKTKDEYITRPDLGRKFDKEVLDQIKADCKPNPSVEVFIADGLSSTAIEANVKDALPALINGLEGYGIDVGTPFFVKHGRVATEDVIAEALNAEVTCILIGERPGLATGESMSAYIVYKGYPGIPEAKRTVVSNIHKNGTPAAEAGAHIADIIKKMLEAKASGVDLKL